MELSCFFFCLVFVMPLYVSICMCLVVTCWERADHLDLVCGVLLWGCYFHIGILGQVWYLIPDLFTLSYFGRHIVISLSVCSVLPSVRSHRVRCISGRNPKFGVWVHLRVADCRILLYFLVHLDFDL